uniref:PP2A regulatory subunit B'' EF-hand domain-containing protein n=1 Tax=Trichobilharzia regenti TaxID=157069 RepID=A0AA85K2V1_TRIRE|nr:unnamed protein product [Trichobilharzia regenti]
MSINSALKLKLDELFLRWITDRATQKVLRENLIQVKSQQPIEAMLAMPSGIVVGPMSASLYGYFYGPAQCESPVPNLEGSCHTALTSINHHSYITSPRPNTPPYFPQPPYSKMCSPRSPRRHLSTPSNISVQAVKGSGESRTNDITHTNNKAKKENGVITIRSKTLSNTDSQDSETKLSRGNTTTIATAATTNRLLTNHDTDEEDINKVKTNKIVSIRTNDRNGSKLNNNTTTTSVTPTSDYNYPSENNKQGVDIASRQQSRESNKHRIHSSQSQNLIHSGAGGEAIGDTTSPITKSNVSNRTDNLRSVPSDSIPCTQNKLSTTAATITTTNTTTTTLPSATVLRKALPSFHFPLGTTRMSSEEINAELERIKREINQFVDPSLSTGKHSEQLIPYSNFGQVAKLLNCPLYWKHAIYMNAGGTPDRQPVSSANLLKTWSHTLNTCPDEASKFVHLLTRGRATFLIQSDFNSLIQDILESHPGLAFLGVAKDFHSRYVATVVARIFFNVNISWSGRISLGELRRSNFLSVLASLEVEDDINLVTQYFSYEHFYVIYCKFWELDEDHDLIISRGDLARHNNYAISERMIDRIFSGAVTRVA